MESVALLIVDVQEAFSGAIPNFDNLVNRCCFAVETANLLEIPCIYTEQNPEKLKGTMPELLESGLRDQGQYFSKMTFSALGAEGAKEYFHDNGIKHILIGGIEASVCVYQTAVEALKEGFGVTLLSDCIAGRRAEDTQAVVATWQGMECARLPSETVFYSVLKDARHPKFRDFVKIVKKFS